MMGGMDGCLDGMGDREKVLKIEGDLLFFG